MSPRTTSARRSAAAALTLAALLGLGACGGSDDDGAAAATPAADPGGTPALAANDTMTEGCPLSAEDITAAFGVPAQGGDTTVNSGRLACTFYLSLDGRSLVLNGVTLPSALKRLQNLNSKDGGKVSALKGFGTDAFTYTRQDPTSETGLAYTAVATYENAKKKDVHWTYKFSLLLPTVDRAYDLKPLLAKLTAMVSALPADHPLAHR